MELGAPEIQPVISQGKTNTVSVRRTPTERDPSVHVHYAWAVNLFGLGYGAELVRHFCKTVACYGIV